jgi:hypothetical protein
MENESKAYFNNIVNQIANELHKAKYCIYVAVAWLNERRLVSILEDKIRNNVSVHIITSQHEFNKINELSNIQSIGGCVYIVGGENVFEAGFMHNKFCVIDYKTVITGSFNWTKNASNIEENIVVINSFKTASEYVEHFHKLALEGKPLNNRSNPIEITFIPSRVIINKNEYINLTWKVNNASIIEIDKIGVDLNNNGSKDLQLQENTVFRLIATSGTHKKIKDLAIRVIQPPNIEASVRQEKIIRGQSAMIEWKSENAERVEIEGIGEVSLNGYHVVNPESNRSYRIIAHGETTEKVAFVSISVYQTPSIKRIEIPIPTQIQLEADISFLSTKIPSKIDLQKTLFTQNVPKIDLIRPLNLKPSTLKTVSKIYSTTPSQLNIPLTSEHNPLENQNIYDTFARRITNFRWLKVIVVDKLEKKFKRNLKLTQIIDLIRKNYNL